MAEVVTLQVDVPAGGPVDSLTGLLGALRTLTEPQVLEVTRFVHSLQAPGARPVRRQHPPHDGMEAEVDGFCRAHGVSDEVRAALLALPPGSAQAVMAPSLDGARSVNAVLRRRCQEAAQGVLPKNTPRDGDWICQLCDAMNFAKRTECHRCGGILLSAAPPPPPALYQHGPPAKRIRLEPEAATPPPPYGDEYGGGGREVDDFCHSVGADAALRQSLLELPPHLAEAVMRTPLDNVRNVTAVLRQRVRAAQQGRLPQNAPRPGDWSCVCGASNFAKRVNCFTCGADRAQVDTCPV